jgi:hypothetical protein
MDRHQASQCRNHASDNQTAAYAVIVRRFPKDRIIAYTFVKPITPMDCARAERFSLPGQAVYNVSSICHGKSMRRYASLF